MKINGKIFRYLSYGCVVAIAHLFLLNYYLWVFDEMGTPSLFMIAATRLPILGVLFFIISLLDKKERQSHRNLLLGVIIQSVPILATIISLSGF